MVKFVVLILEVSDFYIQLDLISLNFYKTDQ